MAWDQSIDLRSIWDRSRRVSLKNGVSRSGIDFSKTAKVGGPLRDFRSVNTPGESHLHQCLRRMWPLRHLSGTTAPQMLQRQARPNLRRLTGVRGEGRGGRGGGVRGGGVGGTAFQASRRVFRVKLVSDPEGDNVTLLQGEPGGVSIF
jgi:hypothetical protein